MRKVITIYFLFIVIVSIIASSIAIFVYINKKDDSHTKAAKGTPAQSTLSKIMKAGKIIMITENGSNSYYIYRDEPMGFEYEIAKEFAAFLQVELEVITPDLDKIFTYLDMGKGDFVASGVTITEKLEKKMLFTQPYMEAEQKIIYNKDKFPIEKIKDLETVKIHVSQNTKYHDRLLELKKSGLDIEVVVHDDLCTEELIRMVSENEDGVSYTVADSHIARLNRRYYPDISIGISIQKKEHIGWAVRKGDANLSDKMVQFFDIIKHNGVFNRIYEKYYGHLGTGFDYSDLKAFHEDVQTRLPKYQKAIVRESEKHGFDWRIIAAVIYQESRFDPKARSETGVRGLMQVTEEAAAEMGVTNRRDPIQNLKAGIGYLNSLYQKFHDVHDTMERIKFALASYNVGYGHVTDAQKIAQKKGLDGNRWASLTKTLPLLSKPRYYSKAKYGYARGHEPIKYIKKVFAYYDILKQKAHSAG
ncbi:MAG: membrane-bound lytic murein transglycosylase MltF [Desulfamplus sp.]|nr:membrane-bound lytic murein transglycosylase MltF [Desulfamplus sp.]